MTSQTDHVVIQSYKSDSSTTKTKWQVRLINEIYKVTDKARQQQKSYKSDSSTKKWMTSQTDHLIIQRDKSDSSTTKNEWQVRLINEIYKVTSEAIMRIALVLCTDNWLLNAIDC